MPCCHFNPNRQCIKWATERGGPFRRSHIFNQNIRSIRPPNLSLLFVGRNGIYRDAVRLYVTQRIEFESTARLALKRLARNGWISFLSACLSGFAQRNGYRNDSDNDCTYIVLVSTRLQPRSRQYVLCRKWRTVRLSRNIACQPWISYRNVGRNGGNRFRLPCRD